VSTNVDTLQISSGCWTTSSAPNRDRGCPDGYGRGGYTLEQSTSKTPWANRSGCSVDRSTSSKGSPELAYRLHGSPTGFNISNGLWPDDASMISCSATSSHADCFVLPCAPRRTRGGGLRSPWSTRLRATRLVVAAPSALRDQNRGIIRASTQGILQLRSRRP